MRIFRIFGTGICAGWRDSIKPLMTTYISLGSNIKPAEHLTKALSILGKVGRVVKQSSIYKTEPLGGKDQPWYLNQVVALDTKLPPEQLLAELKTLEHKLGRQPRGRWESREIDLDILLYETETIATVALQVPHPGLTARRCVLVPLAEIAPDAIEPHSGKTIRQLLAECADPLQVELL